MTSVAIEASLAWLISKSTHTLPHRRLNEIENMLSNLAQLGRPVDVAREVRITEATADELFAWVTEHEPPDAAVTRRLDLYARGEVVDPDARDGWIALQLT